MTTSRWIRRAASVVAVALLAGCTATATPPVAVPVNTPSQEALMAYERYWDVSTAAFADPGARDWTPDLAAVATGAALESVAADVANYADLPAHTEGTVSRSPAIASAEDRRVAIIDCVALGDSRLIADETGEVLDDLANRPERYRFRAEIALTDRGWLVASTQATLDEPC